MYIVHHSESPSTTTVYTVNLMYLVLLSFFANKKVS